MIPQLNAVGELPAGIHETTLDEVEGVFAQTAKRRIWFEGLKHAVENLKATGVLRVHIDGSFVTSKAEPNDVDGCWEWHKNIDLNRLDPVFLDFSHQRQAMKEKYSVEFFVADWVEAGSGLTFLEFFQLNHYDEPKGILMIDLRKMP
ncbi:hypothetical protein HYR99_23165 [Candidatus Poribacteria bacterium]|nr:hypothetical protein [Candidatus Poribacteria bacterium]